MTMATKKSIFEEHLKAWLAARGNKKKRGEMVQHLCFVTGVHPKSVPRSCKRLQMRDPGTVECRGRTTYYTPDVIAALKNIWEIVGESCGENLHPMIGEYVRILTRDGVWKRGKETTAKLLVMSLGSVKNWDSKRTAQTSSIVFLLFSQLFYTRVVPARECGKLHH